MVIDTSALIAIMGDDPERHTFNKLIEAAADPCISAASLLETRMVLFTRSGDNAILALDAFLLKSGMTVVEVSPRLADIAFDAYRHFGKGTGHGADLNYGAYSGETGHPIRGKWPPGRSEATLGIS